MNKEKRRAYQAKYYIENEEKIKARKAKCHTENPEKAKARSAKWYAENKDKSAKYRIENKEVVRAKQIKRAYGINIHDYNEIYDKQQGKCAICGTHQKDLKGKLHIDHNHTTSKVRGLLCVRCNMVLGYGKDSTAILENAINYLNYHAVSWVSNKIMEQGKEN